MNTRKNGPVHFYPTAERDAWLPAVVEYVVQKGERQYVNASQSAYLVASGQVCVDGTVCSRLDRKLPMGVKSLRIRDRVHIVVIHPAMLE